MVFGERVGGATRHPAHLTEEQGGAAGQATSGGLARPPQLGRCRGTQSGLFLNSCFMRWRRSVVLLVQELHDGPPQLSVEEVCDFDAMLRHDWRRLGISAKKVQEFCVWRNAPMRVLSLQGDLVDSYDPALKEHRTVCFLAFDGRCYMYRAVKCIFIYNFGIISKISEFIYNFSTF